MDDKKKDAASPVMQRLAITGTCGDFASENRVGRESATLTCFFT